MPIHRQPLITLLSREVAAVAVTVQVEAVREVSELQLVLQFQVPLLLQSAQVEQVRQPMLAEDFVAQMAITLFFQQSLQRLAVREQVRQKLPTMEVQAVARLMVNQ